MKLLIVGTPDTIESQAIIESGKKLSHLVDAVHLYDIFFQISNNIFKAHHKNLDLLSFDAYLFRGIASSTPQKSQLYNALILAKYFYDNNKIVVDEKLATETYIASKIEYTLSKNNIPTPNTVYTLGRNATTQYLSSAEYPLIIKSTSGSKGKGVFLVNNFEEAQKTIIENEGKKFLFQEYIPTRFDIRVLVVGDKVLGAMRRDAADNDFRSNIAQGGSASNYDLNANPEVAQLALRATRAAHMEIAGVDIMINQGKMYVLEVNRTPQFRGFIESTGLDVGYEIIKYIESKLHKQNGF